MAEIHWIKLSTSTFEDDKVKLIRALPDGDGMALMWIQILCLAGKVNRGGEIMVTDDMPYNAESLSTVLSTPLQLVRHSLETFRRLGMIEDCNAVTLQGVTSLKIVNWDKHQSVNGMERVRQLSKNRVAEFRNRRKLLENGACNATRNATVTLRNAIDSDSDSDSEEDKKSLSTKTCSEPENTDSAPVQVPGSASPKKSRRPMLPKIQFDWEEKLWDGISDEQVAAWSDAYPALKIETELAKAKEWVLANPTRIKSKWRRFLVNWLSRSQERGGDRGGRR